MTDSLLYTILQDAFWTLLLIAGPGVLVAMVVGLLVSIFQATTQIQEQTLTFVPKLISIGISLLILTPYYTSVMISFFKRMTDYAILIASS